MLSVYFGVSLASFVLITEGIPAFGPVTSLPGWDGELKEKSFAGYADVFTSSSANSSMFYWLFESRGQPSTDPVLLWLNGGPGSSSLGGLFMELGPYQLQSAGGPSSGPKLSSNNFSWNTRANLLFIDNPVGTGFSTTSGGRYARDQTDVAADLHRALTVVIHRHGLQTNQLYLSGESYAGKYLPATANKILEENAKQPSSLQLNLRGILVGDGWVYPKVQVVVHDHDTLNFRTTT
jgi:cathepsin A (carboxypeptidase C)